VAGEKTPFMAMSRSFPDRQRVNMRARSCESAWQGWGITNRHSDWSTERVQNSNSKWRWVGKATAKTPSFVYHADDQVHVLELSVCSAVRDGRRDVGQRVKKC